MQARVKARRRAAAVRASLTLAVAGGCLGTVAFAASRETDFANNRDGAFSAAESQRPKQARRLPLAPRLIRHPEKATTSVDVRFVFAGVRHYRPTPPTFAVRSALRFRCQVDRSAPMPCDGELLLRDLEPGPHTFAVRAVNWRGIEGPPARFRWRVVEPAQFSIEPELSNLADLYPGAYPQPLPLRITNPNSVPIAVTSLRVSVNSDPPGCDAASNLELRSSSASVKAPLRIPARGSVHLPSFKFSAPTLALRNLATNQDACQGARFPLTFTGEAHG
jgi:hypothetical protein